jgi:NADH:ubiquinone oxidoreductase subunit 6 (chain J)
MTEVIIFLAFATVAVACAINLVVQRHPITGAISLIGVMGSLAVLYLQLGAEFIAAAQVIVYAGAIMVLFVFVIMLLNAEAEKKSNRSLAAYLVGIPSLVVLLGVLGMLIPVLAPSSELVRFGGFKGGTAGNIGRLLFTWYLLPFEVTSVLVLVALLGAVVLALKEID